MKRALTTALLAGALTAAGAAAVPPAGSAALPEGLAYELVSNPESGGYDFNRARLMPDGDRAIVGTNWNDVNGVYPVVRTETGWQQQGRRRLAPPNGTPLVAAGTVDVSADSKRLLVSSVRDDASRPSEMVIDQLAVGDADGSWRIVGSGVRYADGTPDLRRLIVQAFWGQSDDRRYPALPGRETGVFLWEDDGSDDGTVAAIGTDAPRVMTCGAAVPDEEGRRTLEQSGVSPDTRTVVMSTRKDCEDGGAPVPSHVLRWHDGVTTDLTEPAAGPDGPSEFIGASDDLASVFVRTEVALDAGDANDAADVYRWDAVTGEQTRLTGDATDGGGAILQSAISSNDGSTVWFSTREDDEQSLWVVERGEAPARIAVVTPSDPGDRVFDLRGDALGSNTSGFPAQTTPDGWTLVFASKTVIDGVGGSNPGMRTDAGQIWRATAAGDLDCVSCFADGSPAASPIPGGALGGLLAGSMEMPRIVSDDGEWIWFQTESPLEADDANENFDVYVWNEGERSLVSSGEPGLTAELVNVSTDGHALFTTNALLLPWIEDDHIKVYAARVGGGLPAPPVPRPCADDGCQGDPAPRDPAPHNPTEGFNGPGDEDDPAPPFPANPSMTVGRLSKAAQRKLARGRAVTVAARTNIAGRVTATTSFKRGRRWVKAGAATRTLKHAGSIRLTVRLSRAARAQLARRGSLRVRVDVVHGQVAKPRRLAFVLKRQAPTRRGARA
jgi:hypothetical protein